MLSVRQYATRGACSQAVVPRRSCGARARAIVSIIPGRHANVLCRASNADGSVLDATSAPTKEKSLDGVLHRSPIYKVMLHNDNYNRREYVVNTLVRCIDGFGREDAMQVMEEAHDTGVALVMATRQEEAEEKCETLRLNGLCTTIEPGV